MSNEDERNINDCKPLINMFWTSFARQTFHSLRDIGCQIWNISSSLQKCSIKKGVLKNIAKFTGKHPCQLIRLNSLNIGSEIWRWSLKGFELPSCFIWMCIPCWVDIWSVKFINCSSEGRSEYYFYFYILSFIHPPAGPGREF